MKTIIKTLMAGVVAIGTMTACADNDWDLNKLDTGNTVVTDTIVAPLGAVKMNAAYLLEGVGSVDIPSDILIDRAFSYNMNADLNEALAAVLSSGGEDIAILTTIENDTDAEFDILSEFVSDTNGTIGLDEYSITKRSSKTFTMDVTTDQFERMVGADRLVINVKRTDTGTLTFGSGDYIKVQYAICKIGGIGLDSIL